MFGTKFSLRKSQKLRLGKNVKDNLRDIFSVSDYVAGLFIHMLTGDC